MENNAKQNQDLNNRSFPEDPNQALYGQTNPSSNEKNTEQEGFTDDSGFGHNTVNPEPNPDETEKKDEDIDYEDDNDREKDEKIEEEEKPEEDEDYPGEDENPEEKKKFYLRTNGRKYAVFFDLNFL